MCSQIAERPLFEKALLMNILRILDAGLWNSSMKDKNVSFTCCSEPVFCSFFHETSFFFPMRQKNMVIYTAKLQKGQKNK